MDATNAIEWAVRLTCAARILSSLEYLLYRSDLGPGGLLNYQIGKLGARTPTTNLGRSLERVAQAVNTRHFYVLIGLDLVLSIALELRPLATLLISGAVITHLALMKRNYLASDGSDQMILVILVAALLGSLDAQGSGFRIAATFVALEAALAYAVSGLYKISSRSWMSGQALTGIVNSKAFGRPNWGRLLLRKHIAILLTWPLVLWECLFPISIVAPRIVLICILAVGAMFHVACGVIMGLTNFWLAFVATYPSIVATNQYLSVHLPAAAHLWIGMALVLGFGIAILSIGRPAFQPERKAVGTAPSS